MRVSKGKAAQNRQDILTAAARLFREQGVSATGVDAITKDASLTHGAIYSQFGSKEAIEARIHKPVRFFCYPSGQYDELTIRVLQSADFWGAVTTAAGDVHRSGELFTLRRVRVHGRYSAEALAAVLDAFAALGEKVP